MNRIASFCVDHTKLEKGLYVSRIDGDVVTYLSLIHISEPTRH